MLENSAAVRAKLDPVTRPVLSDYLVTHIRASIDAGRFRAGDRLPTIGEMARAFAVGRGAVREALTKLQMMRIVEVRHGRGAFVLDARGSP
jgi:DNA-binding FadR family transcriptional regulator